MLEIPKAIVELFRCIGIPFEHRHAGLQLADTGQFAFLRTVFPVDCVAPMVDAGPLILESLHKKAGAVNAPAVVGTWADVRPAQAFFHGSDG